jgi:hypothetical protein
MSELEKLPEEELIKLLKTVAKEKTFEHPERIVRSLGFNPFFIIAYGKLMIGKATPAELKKEIANSLETGIKCLSALGFTHGESRKLLMHIAAIVPLRLDSREVSQKLSEVISV